MDCKKVKSPLWCRLILLASCIVLLLCTMAFALVRIDGLLSIGLPIEEFAEKFGMQNIYSILINPIGVLCFVIIPFLITVVWTLLSYLLKLMVAEKQNRDDITINKIAPVMRDVPFQSIVINGPENISPSDSLNSIIVSETITTKLTGQEKNTNKVADGLKQRLPKILFVSNGQINEENRKYLQKLNQIDAEIEMKAIMGKLAEANFEDNAESGNIEPIKAKNVKRYLTADEILILHRQANSKAKSGLKFNREKEESDGINEMAKYYYESNISQYDPH